MRLPEVRDEFMVIAERLDNMGLGMTADRVRYLVRQMHRRSPVRRARSTTPHIPPRIIRYYARMHPTLGYMEIAAMAGTNIGRVSEALAGKRS